jgi:tRNA pseudouridine13 synthase
VAYSAPMHLTEALPGTGGLFKLTPEDFLVEEVPAYLPCGEGEHTLLLIEKRALTTREAVSALCQALGAREADAGTAGLKDRQAVTRQWVSVPRVDPEAARGLRLSPPGGEITVLEAGRHRNKLRTGHLRGNRFVLTLRGTVDGAARATAVLAALEESGVPNRYGPQRFGPGGRNVDEGRRLVRGALRVSDRQRRRFLVSAYQAALFNRYLDARQADGLLRTVIGGDILQKRATGGLFYPASAEEEAAAQERLGRDEVAVTGPMFGGKMMAPPEGSAAAQREAAILAEEELGPEVFRALGDVAEGTRRPLLVPLLLPGPGEPPAVAVHPEDPAAVVLRFALPPGSYASVVLEEVMKVGGPWLAALG